MLRRTITPVAAGEADASRANGTDLRYSFHRIGHVHSLQCELLLLVACLLSSTAAGSPVSISYTGTLASPENAFEQVFLLTASDVITVQTWGFGGGINAAWQAIPAGGFDPLIVLFSGSGPSASILTDGLGNPLADADNLLNPPWSPIGNCPPAGTVPIGTNNDCGDDYLQAALSAGTYTLLLTDASYIPNAVYDNGLLSEGFADLSSGVFQTCDPSSNTCVTTGGNYAVDIVSTGGGLATAPEPDSLSLLSIGLAALAGWKEFNKRRASPQQT